MLKIFIGNYELKHYKDFSFAKRLDALSAKFSFSLVPTWQKRGETLPFKKGERCQFFLGSKPILNGFIDVIELDDSPKENKVTISGRSKTADLVDSAAGILSEFSFVNQSFFEIAKALTKPFGINVVDSANVSTKFPIFSVEPGEKVFESLERAARRIGLVLSENGNGELLIENIGKLRANGSLVEKENILKAKGKFDGSRLHSSYTVYSESENGNIEASAKDLNVKRFRPHLLVLDGDVDQDKAQTRANWEASVRSARADTITVTLQGFSPELDTNRLISFVYPSWNIEEDMLISSLTLTQSQSGTFTVCDLSKQDSYISKPEIKESESGY